MKWLRVGFEHAMTHAVPDTLFAPLVAEMVHRGHPIENFEAKCGIEQARSLGGNPKVIDEWSFDMGGMCYVGEPRESIAIDGLLIDVPCFQIDAIALELRKLAMRRFERGTPYYKTEFWIHATVLTVEQYDRVLDEVLARHDAALARAHDFSRAVKAARMEGVN